MKMTSPNQELYQSPVFFAYDLLAEGVLAVSSEDVSWEEGEFEF